MSDQPENLMLTSLRRLDEKMDGLRAEVRDVKLRLGLIEQRLSLLDQRLDHMEERFNRIEDRLDRIERRLDIVSAG
jgi:chromosome segregation ATPase